jgi:hypothetical protein
MTVSRLSLVAGLLLAALPLASAQSPAQREENGPYLGLLFGPSAQGVQVLHVLPDSPARADLRVNDVIVSYDGQALRGCEHLVQLLQKGKVGHHVTLIVRRDGRDSPIDVTIGSGPVIRLAQAKTDGGAAIDAGSAKPPLPPALRLSATPLPDGQLRVTVEYLPEGAKAPVKNVYCGRPAEIETEVQKLPMPQRNLIQAALRRLLPQDGAPANAPQR